MKFFLPTLCIALALILPAGTAFAQDVPAETQEGAETPVLETPALEAPVLETPPSDEAAETLPEVLPDDAAAPQAPDADNPPATEDGAQNQTQTDVASEDDLSKMDPAIAAEIESFYLPLNILKMPSLFFTKWERDLLIEARSGANVRPVVPGDAGSELLLSPDNPATIQNSPREINLSGIAYISPVSWTIWLNNIRITPTALLPEIMDLTVNKDSIEIEWLDRQTNQIYPIRLRPHEKFNIDTRMFLPADSQ